MTSLNIRRTTAQESRAWIAVIVATILTLAIALLGYVFAEGAPLRGKRKAMEVER